MSTRPKGCHWHGCSAPAAYSYRWPNEPTRLRVCAEHAPGVLSAAQAKGIALAFRPERPGPTYEDCIRALNAGDIENPSTTYGLLLEIRSLLETILALLSAPKGDAET